VKRPHLPALAATALSAFLAACATHPQPGPDVVATKTVYVQVAVPCASATKVARPDFADTAAAIAAIPAGGILALAKFYAEGRQQHLAYEAELEAAVTGCAKPPPGP
jgi:hypothetical protein